MGDLEAQQLVYGVNEEEEEEEEVLYRASFQESEEDHVKYESFAWILLSCVLVLAWGVGLLMLLLTPLHRRAVRRDIRSRQLYITPHAIVYKVKHCAWFPCFGYNWREKHILLPLVTDVVIEQGFIQSYFGIFSVRVANAGQKKASSGYDLQIIGVSNPQHFRKIVLLAVSSLRKQKATSRQNSHRILAFDKVDGGASEEVLLKKLEEVGSCIERLEVLIEKQQFHSSA